MSRPTAVAPVARLLDYTAAGAYIGVSRSTFKAMVKADAEAGTGLFLKVPIGARVLFDRDDLDRYIESRKQAAR